MKKLIFIVFLFISLMSYGQVVTTHNSQVKITDIPPIVHIDTIIAWDVGSQKLMHISYNDFVAQLEATGISGGGGIGGSITEGQIGFGAVTADEITGSADLTWDGSKLNVPDIYVQLPNTGNTSDNGFYISRTNATEEGFFKAINSSTNTTGDIAPYFKGKANYSSPSLTFRGIKASSNSSNELIKFQVSNNTENGVLAGTQKAFTFYNWTNNLFSILADGSSAFTNTLQVDGDPTLGDHVGNQDYNDLRYLQSYTETDPIYINDPAFNTIGLNTGDQNLNDQFTISNPAGSYTTVVGDKWRKGIVTDGDIILNDAGITSEYAINFLNNSGGDITISLFAGQSVLNSQTMPQTLPDGYYAYCEVIANDVWSIIVGKASAGGGDTLPISDATAVVKGSADATKLVRIEADGLTTATTRVITMADADVDLGDVGLKSGANTWTATNTFDDIEVGDGTTGVKFTVKQFTTGVDFTIQDFNTPNRWVLGAGTIPIATSLSISNAQITAGGDNAIPNIGWTDEMYEPVLGNPATTGFILSSTDAGVRSWVANGAGGGNVSNTGTPVNDQIAIWTDATTVEGRPTFRFESDTQLIIGGTGSTTAWTYYEYNGQTALTTTGIGIWQGGSLNLEWEDVMVMESTDLEISFPALSDAEINSKGATSAVTRGWVINQGYGSGGGDVTASANLGDEFLIRGDGAVKGVQNSGITISDTDVMSNILLLTADGINAGDTGTDGKIDMLKSSNGASGGFVAYETATTEVVLKSAEDVRIEGTASGSTLTLDVNSNDWVQIDNTGAILNMDVTEIDAKGNLSLTTKVFQDGRYVNKEVLDNIEETTATRTISTTDMGNIIYCQSASATTVEIPDTWALVRGTTFSVVMEGAGQVTIKTTTGLAEINGSATLDIVIDGQWGTVQFIHLDDNTDDWHAFGKIQ